MKVIKSYKAAKDLLERSLPYSADDKVEKSVREIIDYVEKYGEHRSEGAYRTLRWRHAGII